jgi:hypothetical protein
MMPLLELGRGSLCLCFVEEEYIVLSHTLVVVFQMKVRL